MPRERAVKLADGGDASLAPHAGGLERPRIRARVLICRRSESFSSSCQRAGGSPRIFRCGARWTASSSSPDLHPDNWKALGLHFGSSSGITFSEVPIQFFTQFQSGAQEAGFHRGNGKAESLRGLFCGKFINVPQLEDHAERRIEFADHLGEDAGEFALSELLFGRGAPVLDFPRHGVVFAIDFLV